MMELVAVAAWEGLSQVFSWPNILYPVAGVMLAMMFSSVPGLSGTTLMALAIPLTFTWQPVPVLLFFGALIGGATFMGSMTAILFNIPGTSANAATLLDGYPMARDGRARTAIGCSAAASALGSTTGILILVALIPVMQRLLLLIGPPELLMLAVWGLTMLAAFTGGALTKGLIAGCLGLLLGYVGLDPRTAELRYTFGTLYLHDGIKMVLVFLGIFALGQIIELAVSDRQTISGKNRLEELSGSVREGVLSVFRHFGLFLRSSAIGTVVGLIPGIGGAVASFIAYGHAAQTSGGKGGQFGNGDIRGVLAPEAANDAKDGGSLIPTLAFGIPGSAGATLLLAVLTVHGIETGKPMLSHNLSLAFVLIGSLFLSNWITSILGLSLVNPLVRLTTVRLNLLVPVLLVLVVVGSFVYRGRVEDVWLAVVFGAVGYYLKKHGWPVIPLVIGLVLGPVFEDNLHLTLQLQKLERINFWTRPIAMTLLGLTIMSVASPLLWPGRWASVSGRSPVQGSREGKVITFVLLVLAMILLWQTLGLGPVARLAAGKVASLAVVLLLVQAVLDFRQRAIAVPTELLSGYREWKGFFWVLLLPALISLAGFIVAVPLFTALYMKIRSAESWLKAGLLTVAMWVLIYGGLNRVLGISLYAGCFEGWLLK